MNRPMLFAAIAAALHITPVVVLVKRPDAVQALLPGADAYFAREVHLSTPDAHRLHKAVDWSPEDGVLTFYVGRTGSAAVGALEFVRVDTPHGPIEVAVGFTPQGTVRGVLVTKATVEMKPWAPVSRTTIESSSPAMPQMGPPPSPATPVISLSTSRERWTRAWRARSPPMGRSTGRAPRAQKHETARRTGRAVSCGGSGYNPGSYSSSQATAKSPRQRGHTIRSGCPSS